MRMVIPIRRTLSVPVASPVMAALQQLAELCFCVANTLSAACVSFVSGAAGPWNPYRLKIAETQSSLNLFALFYDEYQNLFSSV